MTRIEEIKKRLEAATPGPLTASKDHSDYPRGRTVGNKNKIMCDCARAKDAEFIANAPADIAYLLKRVEKLEKILTEVKNTDWTEKRSIMEGGLTSMKRFVIEALEEDDG